MPQTIKSRSGRTLVLPTPEEDAAITAAAMSDPDAVPHTDAEWKAVKPLLRRGAVCREQGRISRLRWGDSEGARLPDKARIRVRKKLRNYLN